MASLQASTDHPDDERTPASPLLRKVHVQHELMLPSRTPWRAFLLSEIDPEHATGPLAAFCFMTGFIDAISFTAVFVWCGFQTGNFAQATLACARIATTGEFVFLLADQQAAISLMAFNAGAFLGRIGDRVGPHTRAWLAGGTCAQAAATLLAGACIQMSGQESVSPARGTPVWTDGWTTVGLALMAWSLGLQAIIGKRLNTHFSTTVVLTALWVELVTDPLLFRVRGGRVASRDHRMLALAALFVGALLARLMLSQVGAAVALGFAAGVRLIIAAAWLFVHEKGKGYLRLWDD
ncbi:hypothetical protein GGX14DRAFT_655526, partial [Mycena pura]